MLCRYDKPVKGRKINWMKAVILEPDRVSIVSPYYAKELVSGIENGVEFDSILRKTGITGIVNGMDGQEWNPLTDKFTSIKYDASTVRNYKRLNFVLFCDNLNTNHFTTFSKISLLLSLSGHGGQATCEGCSSSRSGTAS